LDMGTEEGKIMTERMGIGEENIEENKNGNGKNKKFTKEISENNMLPLIPQFIIHYLSTISKKNGATLKRTIPTRMPQ
jgi:hypothetical protein